MSDVISFRLNKDNPREAHALEILEAWSSRGYSSRYVITEALLKLNDPGLESIIDNKIQVLNVVLNHVSGLLAKIGNLGESLPFIQDENTLQSGLADSFLLSIKKAAKPGLKIELLDTYETPCKIRSKAHIDSGARRTVIPGQGAQ